MQLDSACSPSPDCNPICVRIVSHTATPASACLASSDVDPRSDKLKRALAESP
ncbi:hypothetical protein DPMN_180080 [Dreissena polymorpha]|uniref:Uncharacterized protein n=1 Tax=Dreissena polymorpha TaxID=45954 RepID=A0A9D4IK53_DREPO|nr:hypothetical protein DPMN_180080 [Dreissena polymorpha]